MVVSSQGKWQNRRIPMTGRTFILQRLKIIIRFKQELIALCFYSSFYERNNLLLVLRQLTLDKVEFDNKKEITFANPAIPLYKRAEVT